MEQDCSQWQDDSAGVLSVVAQRYGTCQRTYLYTVLATTSRVATQVQSHLCRCWGTCIDPHERAAQQEATGTYGGVDVKNWPSFRVTISPAPYRTASSTSS
mmetsp:Transcript_8610/g.15450  ORF Transcript_8610/g.15450 Transcript_8610/m.15450 type:complete len:101 (+) Transcript_8610:1152-1454(+)